MENSTKFCGCGKSRVHYLRHCCQNTILHCTACCAVLCKLKFSLRCILSGCTVTSRPLCRVCYILNVKFKVCKSVHYRTIQINHQPDATIFQFITLTSVYNSKCFGRFPTRHQELNDCSGSLWIYLRIVVTFVLCSWSGWPARRRTQHNCHHDTKVNPEAATAFIELLITGRKTPETY
jgi:hypothetical protein